MHVHLKLITSFYILFITVNLLGQSNQIQDDSSLLLNINLHYQIPSFQYVNERIEHGNFTEQIEHKGQLFTIQGGFKDFRSDGLWVAFDSNQVPRLLALLRSDTLVFLHLNDSLGRPSHHFTFHGLEKLNEAWYHDGQLTQYGEYSKDGCIIRSYHDNLKRRMTFFIDNTGVVYKKIIYDEEGNFVKETFNVNE